MKLFSDKGGGGRGRLALNTWVWGASMWLSFLKREGGAVAEFLSLEVLFCSFQNGSLVGMHKSMCCCSFFSTIMKYLVRFMVDACVECVHCGNSRFEGLSNCQLELSWGAWVYRDAFWHLVFDKICLINFSFQIAPLNYLERHRYVGPQFGVKFKLRVWPFLFCFFVFSWRFHEVQFYTSEVVVSVCAFSLWSSFFLYLVYDIEFFRPHPRRFSHLKMSKIIGSTGYHCVPDFRIWACIQMLMWSFTGSVRWYPPSVTL